MIGTRIVTVTKKDFFKPILWITLMRLKSKKVEPTIARMINPGGGPPPPEVEEPSEKAPVKPSISIGELIKNIAPNWIRKLIPTHFILVRYSAFIRNNPNFNINISATIKTTLRIISSYSLMKLKPWRIIKNIL